MKVKNKRVLVFVILVCLVVGMLGSMTVFAETTDTKDMYLSYARDDWMDCENRIVYGVPSDTLAITYKVGDSYTLGLYSLTSIDDTSYYTETIKDGAIYVSGSAIGRYFEKKEIILENGDIEYIYCHRFYIGTKYFQAFSGFSGMVTADSDNSAYKSIYNVLTTGKDSNYQLYIPEFNQDTATYDVDLGYLKDIKYQNALVNEEYNSSFWHEFCWNTLTTTGRDLSQDGYDVQYYFKVVASYTSLIGSDGVIGPYETDILNLKDTSDYCYKLDLPAESGIYYDLLERIMNEMPLITLRQSYTRQLYLRPIYYNDGNWTYGGWTRVTFDSDGGSIVDSMFESHFTADDMESDGNGGNTGNVNNSYSGTSNLGTGSDLDSAINNADSVTTTNTDVISNAKSLVSQIGEIPEIIGELFSFLPSWCSTLFGVGFGVIVFLIIYKLIRG